MSAALIRMPEIKLGDGDRTWAAAQGSLITRSGRSLEDVGRQAPAGYRGEARRWRRPPAPPSPPSHKQWTLPQVVEAAWPEPLPVGTFTFGRRVREGETLYSFDALRRIVCRVTGLERGILEGRRRTAPCVKARQILYWAARRYTLLTYPQISERVGQRDHTTAMWGAKRGAVTIRSNRIAVGADAREVIAALWAADWPQLVKTRSRP